MTGRDNIDDSAAVLASLRAELQSARDDGETWRVEAQGALVELSDARDLLVQVRADNARLTAERDRLHHENNWLARERDTARAQLAEARALYENTLADRNEARAQLGCKRCFGDGYNACMCEPAPEPAAVEPPPPRKMRLVRGHAPDGRVYARLRAYIAQQAERERKVAALVTEWRARVDKLQARVGSYNSYDRDRAEAIDLCADALEEALATPTTKGGGR